MIFLLYKYWKWCILITKINLPRNNVNSVSLRIQTPANVESFDYFGRRNLKRYYLLCNNWDTRVSSCLLWELDDRPIR